MHEYLKRTYDFAIVMPNLLHMPTGGDREVTLFCRRLVKDDFNVAIIYLKNPLKSLKKMLNDNKLNSFLKTRPLLHTVYYSVMSTKIGFYIIRPIIRKVLGIDFREDYDGATLLFLKNVTKIKSRFLIAQSWETAYFVAENNKSDFKYYRLHHSLDDPSFSGELYYLAARSFNLPLKKIVMNDEVYRRFENDSPIRVNFGIETAHFPCKTKPEDREMTVLIPLRRNRSKGAEIAIEALKILHDEMPDAKIISYGNYPKRKIPVYIDFRGTVKTDELVNLYNYAAVMIIPSFVEGTSLPALESMACGSALISTDNEGVPSMIKNGQDGIIIPVNDPRAMADAVKNLLNDNNKRIKIAYEGLKTSKKYSYERTYREMMEGFGVT